jgi:hypothetical protein
MIHLLSVCGLNQKVYELLPCSYAFLEVIAGPHFPHPRLLLLLLKCWLCYTRTRDNTQLGISSVFMYCPSSLLSVLIGDVML